MQRLGQLWQDDERQLGGIDEEEGGGGVGKDEVGGGGGKDGVGGGKDDEDIEGSETMSTETLRIILLELEVIYFRKVDSLLIFFLLGK